MDYLFQSTRLREARQCLGAALLTARRVSIHAPAGGATISLAPRWLLCRVSIHAPAGGATRLSDSSVLRDVVSIHAPAGGATATQQPFKINGKFQSTRLREARLAIDKRAACLVGVSIHAPAGGATMSQRPNDHQGSVSIHAPAGGATAHNNAI